MDRVVIGLGTGRCGTRSLARFLNEYGIKATHERYRLTWVPCEESRWPEIAKRLESDVGFYWLNYAQEIIQEYPDSRLICLKRDKQKVIASYMKTFMDPIYLCMLWTRTKQDDEQPYYYRTNVTEDDLEKMDEATREFVLSAWDVPLARTFVAAKDHFPDYPLDDKEAYLSRYYDDYYIKSESLQAQYPDNFKQFDLEYALNTEDGRSKILNFIGVAPNTTAQ